MAEEKGSIDNVDFPGVKSPEPEKPSKKATQNRVVVVACIVASVLIAIAVSCAVTLIKRNSTGCETLVEVNLEEGDVLTYQVNQTFEISGTQNQKGTNSILATTLLKSRVPITCP